MSTLMLLTMRFLLTSALRRSIIVNMKRSDVIAILKKRQGERSIRKFADELCVSAAYLSDVYLGRREPGKKILKPLGMRVVKTSTIVYEKGK